MFAKLFILLLLILTGTGIVIGKNYLPKKDTTLIPQTTPAQNMQAFATKTIEQAITIVAQNLEVPWALAFLPDGNLLVTERKGTIRIISKEGILDPTPIGQITDVLQIGESGLHGIAAHPDFSTNNFIYLYYTYKSEGENTLNRVVRYTLKNKKLSDQKIMVDKIPGALFHDGGRVKFGPDKNLYITTGDAQQPSLAQDKNSLAGKILRVTDQGEPAAGNPFVVFNTNSIVADQKSNPSINRLIFSYGHRNPQGITWDDQKQLWETEHGQSATDEVNLIKPGYNYGWPIIQGKETREGMISPILQSGNQTWAPGGIAFYKGSLYFAGLRGQALFKAEIQGTKLTLTEYFQGKLGRIRDVIVGPDNMLYITTSNKDGRGSPKADDDKIIRIAPNKL